MVGQTISHYKITEKLGEGGMGVVYKAEDTKLDRPVALKFLANHLVSDDDVRKRFEREAKAAATLNHPNICTVHEIDEFEGKTFIAMAFLEGEGLDKKIENGPLKLKDALDVAIQTAQGLQAAHEKGIVHRDIKPANLMVTGSGPKQLVTIMDFGLAQLADRSKLTRTEETMGTVTYMSPEQTYGTEIDHRSDIWSLGVVIYEMVTGQQPFKGHYDKAVMYSITNEEPEPMTAVRTGVPMELELLVNKCLAKEADRRFHSTADMVVDLETLADKFKSGKSTILQAQAGSSAIATQPTATTKAPGGPLARYRVIENLEEHDDNVVYRAEDTELHRSVAIRVLPESGAEKVERAQRRKQGLILAVGVLGVLLALVFAFFPLFSPGPITEAPVRRFTLRTNERPVGATISPNGRHVAYLTGPFGGPAIRTLWVQDLDQNEPRAVVGPASLTANKLFWSPDSEYIGFRSGDNFYQKVPVSGGPVVTLVEGIGGSTGSAWTPDGEFVVVTLERKLFKLPSRGGQAEIWLDAEQEEGGPGAWEPAFFSLREGENKVLFVEANANSNARIIALDRTSGQREFLAEGRYPIYDPSGHVVYRTREPSGIWAIPFSVDKMKATGSAFPISEDGSRHSLSQDGTLVYLEAPTVTQDHRLVWRDREGNHLGTIGQPQRQIRYPALSPDQKRVAVFGGDGTNLDIWIHEVDRPVKTRLTTAEGSDLWPTWSPSSDRVGFASARTGRRDIYVRRSDGSGQATPLLMTEDVAEYLTDWSQDENTLLFFRRRQGSGGQGEGDIFYLKRKEDGSYEEFPFLTSEFEEATPQFSPDEQFVAYTSNESGAREVYIRAFPEGGSRRRVSVNGGIAPRWRSDGKELFYVEGETLMAVPVSTSPSLTVGTPQALFSALGLAYRGDNFLGYDVTPEGDRFVIWERMRADTDAEAEPVIRVVQNWYEEFREREQD